VKNFTYQRIPKICSALLALSVCSLGISTALAQQSNLIERSPFSPPSAPERTAPRQDRSQPFPNIDFVGYSGTEDDWEIALFFAEQNQVHWMREGDEVEGVELVAFSPRNHSVDLRNRQSSRTIRLNDVKPQASNTPPPIVNQQQVQQQQAPGIPTEANNNAPERRRVIPRRRVILPRATSNQNQASSNSRTSSRSTSSSDNNRNDSDANASNRNNGNTSTQNNQATIERRTNSMVIPRDRPVPPREGN